MIYEMTNKNVKAVAEMASQIWTKHTADELIPELESSLFDNNSAVFVKYVDSIPIGFAQCSLRNDYVEGTNSSPVGYLEGIYVKPEYRNQGFAKELLKQCEQWSAEKGCAEFASDCELDNSESLEFHKNCGFTEANRIICFTKKLLG